MVRRALFGAAGALIVCLLAASPPRVVGDGAEYLTMALNFASGNGPAIAPGDIAKLQRQLADVDPRLDTWDIRGASFPGPDHRRDSLHFWIYPLIAAPLVAVARGVGVSPLWGFAAVNVGLLAAAFWVAIPRLGGAGAMLLFIGPILWWIDKPHTEIFTFSLLAIAFLTIRDRPWCSLVAAGFAAAQNFPVAVLVVSIACGSAVARAGAWRDRRLLAATLAALCLCALPPAYTFARHRTLTLLAGANPSHTPSLAEVVAVPLDPATGLVANFPAPPLAVIAAIGLLVYRRARGWPDMDAAIALVTGAAFLFTFSQAANIHHGGTPGMSRYGLWLIPLAIPFLARAHETASRPWHVFLSAAAAVSSAVSVIMFHPAVAEHQREPTAAATYLWTHHPGWNNPLPEIFVELLAHDEVRSAPAWTPGCEKVLLIGHGGNTSFPIPCFPMPVPAECRGEGVLCYANLYGRRYRFVRAPGSAIAVGGFSFDADRVWPAGSEAAVRGVLDRVDWSTLEAKNGSDSVVRFTRGVQVTELRGASRLILVLRDIEPGAEMMLRVPSGLRGPLIDGMTGQTIRELRYDGAPLEPWQISIPVGARLMFLTLLGG
jgi:hypothetical protein